MEKSHINVHLCIIGEDELQLNRRELRVLGLLSDTVDNVKYAISHFSWSLSTLDD